MPTKKILTPVEPGFTYHIYNRGNNYQNVFFSDEDYQLFLNKFKFYLGNYCSLFAFALLPNHFHFLLRSNENNTVSQFSKQYLKFILSYTNKINYRMKRNGSLFLARFRRIKIEDEDYQRRLLYYIHHNPVKHGITENFKTYKFNSYQIFLSDKPTGLARNEALSWYGDLKGFAEYHDYFHEEDVIRKLTFEND